MSSEDFEVLPSQDSNDPNHEEKDLNNSSNDNNNEMNSDLITSDVQLVNSQSVSSINHNNDIQEAMESSLISSSHLQSKSSSPSPPPPDLLLFDDDDEKKENEPLNTNDINNEIDDGNNSDMNIEDTPPNIDNMNVSQCEAIMVNHEMNDNEDSNNNNDNFSEKHDKKEQEEDDEEEEEEGSVPEEGNHDDNNRPIVSSINSNHNTPNRDRNNKIYDNPYLNGSKSTPGADDQDGEQSDNIDDDDDDDNIIKPLNFTIKHDDDDLDQSDEEKEDIDSKKHDKKPQQEQPQQPPQQQQQQEINDNPSYLNRIMMIISVIFVIIAYYYNYNRTSTTPNTQKPDQPKLHCPASVVYVPLDGKSFYLNASHTDHPATTNYEWDVINMMDYDDLLIDGEDTSSLLLMKGRTPGTISIDLYISSKLQSPDNMEYVFNKQCSMNIIFHESPYFGIDLGTTYSCIAYQERPQSNTLHRNTKIIVADAHRGEYCIPTAIYFAPNHESTQVIIGEDALKKLATDPLNVIYDIKRIIGRKCNDPDIELFRHQHLFNVTCLDKGDHPKLFIPNLGSNGGEYIVAEQALSVILAHLVEIASKEFGVPYIRDIVVSIPALFHNGQRKAIRSSCNIVGLNVKQLVVEPTAAALAYSYYSLTPADNFKLFLTFDIGGGTIDCSVLRCTGVDCQVLGVKGNSSLGGIDFDHIIKDIMIKKYETEHKWDNIRSSAKLQAKFLKVAERVKKSLSVSTQHQVTMTNDELLKDDFSTFYTEKKQVVITRKEFEQHPRTKELIDSAIETAKMAINTDRIKASNVRMILMIGGTTKIPIIQERLKEEFGINTMYNNDTNDRKLKLVFPSDDPQLMVVKGSAIIGASLAFEGDIKASSKQIVLEDVIPLSLGFRICETNNNNKKKRCGIMDVIIEKNSHYPTRNKTIYCQKDPKSSVANLDLYEGDNEFAKNNYLLSHLSIHGIPRRDPNVCDSIIVQFIIDKNGIAHIEAIINDKNKSDTERERFSNSLSVVSNDGNLSKQDIEILKKKMIEWFKGHESIQSALLS